jgi:transketolase
MILMPSESSVLEPVEIVERADELRRDVIRMVSHAGSGHTAGPLGMADIFATLYFRVLRHRPEDPGWEDRDRLILSNGHICPVRYAAMARAGYFQVEELMTLRRLGSRLQGHPERTRLPGVETTSGPLGSGLSQAAGIAYAFRLDGCLDRRVYCICSDAEHQEGNLWEAAMFASKYALGNLTAIVDRNHIQIDGRTETVMPLEPLRDKYESFGWHVLEIDGHDVDAIVTACEQARAETARPTVVIAHTIPGKGVDFMECDYHWHSKDFAPGEAEKALSELRSLGGRITGEHE